MNRTRIVAAVAALAIGFGITIVGLNTADDPDAVIATVDSAETEPSEDEIDAAGGADGGQEDEAADSPPDGDVVDDTAQVDMAPSSTDPGASSQADNDPAAQSECEPVLVVFTGSGEILIFSIERGEVEEVDGEVFLRGSDATIEEQFRTRQIERVLGVLDERLGGRSVEDCQSGEYFEATVGVDFDVADDESVSGELAGEPDDAPGGVRFPCSDDAFAGLFDELGGLEQTALASDADVFVRVIARRLARFGTSSVEEWEPDVRDAFGRFVEAEGCSTEFEEAFVADSAGTDFFCAAANVSADDRLYEFFVDAVPNQIVGCQYDPEEGVN